MKNFFIIGHRGACYYEPENTLRSFKKALKLKCKYIECDVRLTKDNKIVIMHDETVNRTTNGKGSVKDFTLKELKKLNAGKGEKIPTLQEYINLLKNKTIMVIEIKKDKDIVKRLIKAIRKNKIEDKILIVSFHPNYLKEIKKHNKNIKTGLLSVRPLLLIKKARRCKADLVSVYHGFLSKKLIKKIHKNNLKIFAYERVKENLSEKNIKKLINLGLDGMALNKPILH